MFPLLLFRSFSFPLLRQFLHCLFGVNSVVIVVVVVVVVVAVVGLSNDSVFGVFIENNAFSNVSAFRSLHFENRFQISPFSIVYSGNTNSKTEILHYVFV